MATSHNTPPGDTWHINSLSGLPQGAYGTLKPTVWTIPSRVRTCYPILIYTTRSTFYGTMLSHLRQPVTARIPPPVERKDRNDNKPSPTMMALPLPSAIMKSQKSPPTIKGDMASDTIKGPSCKEKRYTFLHRKGGRLIIRRKANKTIGRCVRTIDPDVFCRNHLWLKESAHQAAVRILVTRGFNNY